MKQAVLVMAVLTLVTGCGVDPGGGKEDGLDPDVKRACGVEIAREHARYSFYSGEAADYLVVECILDRADP